MLLSFTVDTIQACNVQELLNCRLHTTDKTVTNQCLLKLHSHPEWHKRNAKHSDDLSQTAVVITLHFKAVYLTFNIRCQKVLNVILAFLSGSATHISWSKCCLSMCLDVNQGVRNPNRCTSSCNPAYTVPLMNPDRTPETMSVWPTLLVKIFCWNKWAWICILRPGELHSLPAVCLINGVDNFSYLVDLEGVSERVLPCRLSLNLSHWSRQSLHVLLVVTHVLHWRAVQRLYGQTQNQQHVSTHRKNIIHQTVWFSFWFMF